MRTEIRNELSPVVARAAALGKTPGSQARESGASTSRNVVAPADTITAADVDAGGNTFTVTDFTLGVDTLGSPTAELRVQGNTTDYGS